MPTQNHLQQSEQDSIRSGLAYGLAAFTFWGFVPIYFKSVAHVPVLEVLAHRIVWSVVILAVIMGWTRRWRAAFRTLRNRRTLAYLAGTTVLIAVNWFLFIWAVANGKVLQASLGYFINPLVNVLLGFIFLRERLRRLQSVSVILAFVGVLYLTVSYGELPVIALALAVSFGCYGLLRKLTRADSLVGLTAETALLLPLAVGYVVYLASVDRLAFGHIGRETDLLLATAGLVTALPLLWFASAARRLRLATVGFMQYIAPSLQLMLAVVLYREPFTTSHLISFGCIWLALALYSADSLRKGQPANRRPKERTPTLDPDITAAAHRSWPPE